MKKFARVLISTMTLVLCFALCACGTKYHDHYSSSAMVEKNSDIEASVSFDSFSGTYVIKLRSNGTDEVFITYNATLKDGSVKVYYDYNDEKSDLFEIEAGGSVDSKTEAFIGNKIIYVIIESDGKCGEGSFSFTLEKSQK